MFFKKDLCFIDNTYQSKKDTLKAFSDILVEKGYAKNAQRVLDLVFKREGEFPTNIGNAIAIPHIRDDVMNTSVILFAKVKPLVWQEGSQETVQYIFFIALDASTGEQSHLNIIANLSRMFMKQAFIDQMHEIVDYDSLVNLINKFMSEEVPNNPNQQVSQTNPSTTEKYDVVAVTACPTGIAHTFMAAQKLEDAAKKMNLKIKVETQGTEGSRNSLTVEDMQNAKGIILATDKIIDLSRFAGRSNVLEISTKLAITQPDKQIQKILDNQGKTMVGRISNNTNLGSSGEDLITFKNFGRRLWKGVMNGVNYMLPFVVFGGILIAISFLIDIHNAGSSNFGSGNSTAKWFNTLGGISFSVFVPILGGYIAYGLVGKLGLLPGFICGFISIGKFVFSLDPTTGTISWLETGGATSGFFGAIVGGFLSAAGIIVFSKYIFGRVPQSLQGIKNILFIPLLGTLVIASIFWIINIPFIYLNYGFYKMLTIMSDKPYLGALLGLVIGIMMATDLGGPINKAAYLASVSTLDVQNNIAMAACMISGMIPPLGIAVAATLFKNLYSKQDRPAALSNYVMGLAFISEGAIPYTAENPKVMVPANIAGGAVSGLLAGALGLVWLAPHGGIFTIPLISSHLNSNWSAAVQTGVGIALFFVILIVSSLVSAFMIYFLTKVFARSKNKKNKVNVAKAN